MSTRPQKRFDGTRSSIGQQPIEKVTHRVCEGGAISFFVHVADSRMPARRHETNREYHKLVSELPIDDIEFAEIVCEFIERVHDKQAAVHVAHGNGQIAELSQLAHWLKGSGGTAGFPALTDSARRLEVAIHARDPSDIETELSQLDSLISRIEVPALTHA